MVWDLGLIGFRARKFYGVFQKSMVGGPYNKDYVVVGSRLGRPICGKLEFLPLSHSCYLLCNNPFKGTAFSLDMERLRTVKGLRV